MAIQEARGKEAKPTLMSIPNEVRDHIWKCYIEAGIPPFERNDNELAQSLMNVFQFSVNSGPTPTQAIPLQDAVRHIAPLQNTSSVIKEEVHSVLTTRFKIQGLSFFRFYLSHQEDLHSGANPGHIVDPVSSQTALVSQARHIQFQFICSGFVIAHWKEYLESLRRTMPHLQSVVMYCEESHGPGRSINPPLDHVRDALDVFSRLEASEGLGSKE